MTSLSLVVIRCGDIDRSRTFYEGLGLRFAPEQHESGPRHYSCNIAGVILELYPRAERSTAGLRLGFRVDSLAAILIVVAQSGGRVVSTAGTTAIVEDPDGHKVELVEGVAQG